MQDFQLDEKRRQQLDANIRSMLEGGASEDDVMRYASDFKNQFGKKKAQSDSIPTVEISQDVLKTGFVPQSSVPSSGTISPLEIPRPQGQSEKVRVEAAPKPKETKYGGSGVLNIGEPYTGKPSERTQRLIEAGGAFKPETKEKDLIRRSIEKGSLQGELANALPIDSKPNEEQLKKIANINKKMASLPQSDAEKAYQKDGFGMFKKDPLLGAEWILETIISSGAALFESGKRSVAPAVAAGAAIGAPTGIGFFAGAAAGIPAGFSAGGVNLSTSSKIMELLNESGVDISDEDSLIAAFSDEKKMAQLRKKAADYALPIFYFDLAAAGLAGRFANKAVGKSVGKKVLAATKEVGLQSAAGSAGELTGQLASGQKVNWSDVAMEGIASIATDAPELVRPIGSLVVGRKNASSNNKTIVKQVVNLGEEVGKQDAVENLKRDLNNGVISEEEYKQGLEVVEKAAEVAKNVPPDLSPKEKVEIIQSVVEDREPDFGMGDVTDDEYNVFVDKGIVTDERLNDIAKKVKEQDQLDEREKAIFTSNTGQINDIIAQQEAFKETQPQPIQPEEQITTEEQFKEPLVETVEEESQVIPLQKEEKSQGVTLQGEQPPSVSEQGEGGVAYYHGTDNIEIKKGGDELGFFTTPNFDYANRYATEVRSNGKVYVIKEQPKNTFSTENDSQLNKLLDLFRKESEKLDNDYLDGVSNENPHAVLRALKNLEKAVAERKNIDGALRNYSLEYEKFHGRKPSSKHLKETLLKEGFDTYSTSEIGLEKEETQPVLVWLKGKPKLEEVNQPNKPTTVEVKQESPKKEISVENNKTERFLTKSGKQLVYVKGGELVVESKDGKPVSPQTRKKAIKEYAESFDFSKGETAPEPTNIQFRSEEEAKDYVIENSKNPYEIAEVYVNEEPTEAKLSSTERMIAEYGIGKVTGESYNRHGDRNNMNMSKAKTYISKDGIPLDVKAKEMSDYYDVEITPQDLVEFMDRFPSGERQALREVETDTAIKAVSKFKELTGMDLSNDLAKTIVEKEFNKLSKEQQLIAEQDYETAKQLEDAYWQSYKETDGFTKESPVSETKQAEPTKSIKDKFKDIADINLSDNPEVVKKREVTKYLKDNPEIADVVKNFEKVTEYLKSEKELKVICD